MAVRYQMAVGLNKGHKVTKVDNPRKLKEFKPKKKNPIKIGN
jgi:hypothetical protein